MSDRVERKRGRRIQEILTAAAELFGERGYEGVSLEDVADRLEALPAQGSATERLRALLREHSRIAVCEYPAALRLFLAPREWPAGHRARIKEMRRRHDRVFRVLVEEGLATGEFTVTGVDPALRCMHAAMSQAPAWCADRTGAELETALDELADTLMMLVGRLPR